MKNETKTIEYTREQWVNLGTKLFGEDMLKWRFVCPSCGNIQTVEDFKTYKDKGATPEDAYFNCIGRFDGHGNIDMLSGKSPCNYTSGGLFNINKIKVTDSGKEHYVFDFARSAP